MSGRSMLDAVHDTEAFVAANDVMLLVVFRGTFELTDWTTNLRMFPRRVPMGWNIKEQGCDLHMVRYHWNVYRLPLSSRLHFVLLIAVIVLIAVAVAVAVACRDYFCTRLHSSMYLPNSPSSEWYSSSASPLLSTHFTQISHATVSEYRRTALHSYNGYGRG